MHADAQVSRDAPCHRGSESRHCLLGTNEHHARYTHSGEATLSAKEAEQAIVGINRAVLEKQLF